MFFWRMIVKALREQFGRRLMIAITVALGASLTTSMLAVMLDVGDKVNEELGSYGANIEVLPASTSVVSDLYDLEDGGELATGALAEDEIPMLKTIFWAYNIEDFAPFLDVEVEAAGEPTTVVGTWFEHEIDLPTGESVVTGINRLRNWWALDGAWPEDSTQAIVGKRLADSRGWGIGDTVDLAGEGSSVEVTIVGIVDAGSSESSSIYTSLDVAQSLAEREGEVAKIEVRALTTPENDLARKAARDPSSLSMVEWEIWYCTAYVSSISYQIEEVMTNASADPVQQIADTQGAVLDKTQTVMTLIAVFAIIGSALGITNLVTASVMERSREIGMMKALGARNGSVVALILTETMIVGLAGGVVGFGAGVGLAQLVGHMVFDASITIRPIIIGLMVLVVVVTILIGSLPAIRSLVRLEPTQVLHGR